MASRITAHDLAQTHVSYYTGDFKRTKSMYRQRTQKAWVSSKNGKTFETTHSSSLRSNIKVVYETKQRSWCYIGQQMRVCLSKKSQVSFCGQDFCIFRALWRWGRDVPLGDT